MNDAIAPPRLADISLDVGEEDQHWCKAFSDLPVDVLERVIAFVDSGTTLAQASAACTLLKQLVEMEVRLAGHHTEALRLVASHQLDEPQLARALHCLSTSSHARFCVIGGVDDGGIGFATTEGLRDASFAAIMMPDDDEWAAIPPPTKVREGAAAVRAGDGKLVVIGGTSFHWDEGHESITFRTLASVEACVVIRAIVWSEMAPMSVARCCCGGAVSSNGSIFAVGGGESMFRGSQCFDSAECFSPETRQWSSVPSMHERRCGLGVAIDLETDTLFAFGGYAGGRDGAGYLDTCECLDVGANASSSTNARWRPLPQMSCRRAGPNACAAPDGRLFVIGGGPDGQTQWSTMEALDPRTASWDTSLAQLHVGRHYNAAAFGPDGLLYVSGSFRHVGQLDVVERYDPRADRWELLSQVGTVIKFGTGVFVF